MKRTYATGKTHTVGSSSARGGWEAKDCVFGDRCLHGGRIVLAHNHAVGFHLDDTTGRATSYHADCARAHGSPYEAAA